MATGIQSLIDNGSKLWLDSVDPDLTTRNREAGITGATSNPAIIADLIGSGRFDDQISELVEAGHDDEAIAWEMTDRFVSQAMKVFLPVWERTECNDGWVSFELDPLLEDTANTMSLEEKTSQYIELGKRWFKDQKNRMIKVPATPAGLGALEELAAAGVTLNVTLIFSQRQYEAARDAIWKGAQRRDDGLQNFKSVYSIFISRVDVYTAKHVTELSDDAQGLVGITNVKQLWEMNEEFWGQHQTKLQQEIIFASTGAKLDWQDEDYYPKQLAGSGIQTNPPKTNDAIAEMGKSYGRTVDVMPADAVVKEIEDKVDEQQLEAVLMEEGLAKFADPHKTLIETIAKKRQAVSA